MAAFIVTINRNGKKKTTTVFYDSNMTEKEVRLSLINHDGFPSDITVKRRKSNV